MSNKWEKSKFNKKIRISEEDLEFLRKIKGKKCMAGKLSEIIMKYKKAIKRSSLLSDVFENDSF